MALPRGIQELKRKNRQGGDVIRYRVQINRKDFKQDRLFERLDEAVEFLNAAKSVTGQKQIHLLEEQQKREGELVREYLGNPPLTEYIKKYIEDYVAPRFSDCDPTTDEGKIRLRNKTSIIAFLNIIKNTVIPERADEQFPLSTLIYVNYKGKKPMGNFNPRQISEHEINEYIKARRALNIKPISIERELSVISNVFNKLRYLDIRMKDVPNPTRLYDRDLLKVAGGRITKNVHRFTSEEKEKFFETLDNYENPELAWISKLILLTAMRRTETVLLKWSQIFENHLRLETTKRGRPRIVYLSPEAKELLSSIPKRGNEDRVFTYGVLGYDSSFKRVMKDIGLSHIKIHGLRKEAISTFIERIGAGNSVLIAEFLGVSSVRTIEEHVESNSIPDLATQEQVLKSVGHSNSAVTKNHYFSFKK